MDIFKETSGQLPAMFKENIKLHEKIKKCNVCTYMWFAENSGDLFV